MSRIITADRRQQIADARIADPEALGPMLGELVVEGNVPVEAVAELLSVSDVTIYRWMYGMVSPRDEKKIVKLKRLLTVLRKAKRARDLPLGGSVRERVRAVGRLVIAHRPVPKPSE
jgi:hypothetical protein